jgi:hypothetical protein
MEDVDVMIVSNLIQNMFWHHGDDEFFCTGYSYYEALEFLM